jgi:bifunctional non-homologous end joining protein LigD
MLTRMATGSPNRVPPPRRIEPMLAVPGELPADHEADRYAYEVKWDGVRAVAYADAAGSVEVTGRRGTDITATYPELAAIAARFGGRPAVVDGEVVAFDAAGRPSFAELQRRMHVTNPAERGLTRMVPIGYMVFDLLYFDGSTLFDLPYTDRRELLDGLDAGDGDVTGPGVHVPPYLRAATRAQARALLDATAREGLEGLVAKRLDTPYRPGARADFWLKIKNTRTQEVVIAGWKPGQGRRAGGIGSLLIGVPDETGLRYVGHVGTGFTDAMLDDLLAMLRPLTRPTSPYADEVPRQYAKDAVWTEPTVVGEVEFTDWTPDHRLRAPSWRGLRPDKSPDEVREER